MARHRNQRWWKRWPVMLLALVLVAGAGWYGGSKVFGTRAAASGCPVEARQVTVGVDPAVQGWVGQLADAYNGEHRVVSGLCSQLKVVPMTLDRAEKAIQSTPLPSGGEPPDIWIPESSVSVDLLRESQGSKSVLPDTAPSLASSPLVIAAPDEVLDSIKAPAGGALQLADYLGLANSPQGWGKVGHPSWGKVQFSTGDPYGSTTGIGLLQAVAATAAGQPLDKATAATFEQPAAQAGLLQFVHTLARTTANSEELFGAAASMASATAVVKAFGLIVATEQEVYRYNRAGGSVPLRAAYPFGGYFADDFPVISVNGNWVTGYEHSVSADFLGWSRTRPVQQKMASWGLRQANGSASALSNTAKANGLDPTTQAPKRGQQNAAGTARSLWNLFTRPGSILEVFDTSQSMGQEQPGTGRTRIELARQAGKQSLQYFMPRDHLGLWEFSTELDGDKDYRQVVPLRAVGERVGWGTQADALAAGYDSLQPHDATGLYDTILAAYTYAQKNYLPDSQNSIILITDGVNDDASGIGLTELLDKLKQLRDPGRPVHLITIALGDSTDPATLEQIAKTVDGLSYTTKDLSDTGELFLTAQITLANSQR